MGVVANSFTGSPSTRRFLLVPVLSLLATLGVATGAHADGGTYPSNAPTIVPGSTVTGGATKTETDYPQAAGKAGVQYYKVNLAFGDHLVIDLTDVTGNGADLCIMSPATTDYTVSNASCLESAYTGTTRKTQLSYVAPSDGAFLVVPNADDYNVSWAYSMNVYVQKPTAIAASTPKSSVRAGKSAKVVGQFSPGIATSLILQIKKGGWATVGQTNSTTAGTFAFKYKTAARGRYKFRVLFAGGGNYTASQSNTVTVRAH